MRLVTMCSIHETHMHARTGVYTWSLPTCNFCVLAASPLVSMVAIKRGRLPWGLPTPPATLMPKESYGPWSDSAQTHKHTHLQPFQMADSSIK